MEIELTGYNSGYKRYLDISKPYTLECDIVGDILIEGTWREQYDSYFKPSYFKPSMLVRESFEQIKKLIEKAKFDASFESKLCD